MTMKLTQLRTYWDADDAYCVIAFLDELRDALWDMYGDEIIEAQQATHLASNQTELSFDDDIEF